MFMHNFHGLHLTLGAQRDYCLIALIMLNFLDVADF